MNNNTKIESNYIAFYDKDIGCLEVIKSGRTSCAHPINDELSIFIDEETNEVVGFIIENGLNELRIVK